MHANVFRGGPVLLLALFASSCRSKAPADAPDARGPAGTSARPGPKYALPPRGPAEHWAQGRQLRVIMQRIGDATGSKWPNGLPDDPERPVPPLTLDEAFRAGAALGGDLASAAGEIPGAVAGRPLAPEDRQVFNVKARELRDEALRLREAAEGRNADRMQRAIDDMAATCLTCHARYRDITGPLDVRQGRSDDAAAGDVGRAVALLRSSPDAALRGARVTDASRVRGH